MESQGDVAPAREYEFDILENEVIAGLARPMRFVGIISIVFGVLTLIPTFLALGSFAGMLELFEAIALMAIGGWLTGAASSFRDIVNTDGTDISNLMIALRKLRSAFTVQAWIMAIACFFIVIDIVLVLRAYHH
ncbi:MAG TPA: hypothetical protein VGG74_16015 [Kofleriaceae bacterium]|jgi:hypothetical protein